MPLKLKNTAPERRLAEVDIAMIGATPFRRHSYRKDTDVFITSIYKIKRIIKEKR